MSEMLMFLQAYTSGTQGQRLKKKKKNWVNSMKQGGSRPNNLPWFFSLG